jgi:hypothetical protein
MATSRTRTTPPAEPEAQDGKAPPDVADDERGVDPDDLERVALYPRRLVRHAYDSGGQTHTRYGIVVDPDGPLVAWLQVEHAGHLAEALEGL